MSRSAALALLLLPLMSNAGWVDGHGDALAENDSMRSSGRLLAKLALTPDEQASRRMWNASGSAPQLQVTRTTTLGSTVSTVLVFQGCEEDASGQCDLEVEFSIVHPDGAVEPGGAGKLWAARPLPQRFMLGAASATVRFDADDDIGVHTVRAKVVDRIARRSLELATQVRV